MKHLRYLPLAFLAGQHGFALLAPYLAICMTAYAVHLQRKRRSAALVPVGVHAMPLRASSTDLVAV